MLNYDKQHGFHVIEIIIVVAILGVLGFVAWRVFMANSQTSTESTNNQPAVANFVEWSFNGETWQANNPPDCEEPLVVASPMNASKATHVLLPGQIRGGDFKPHGGIGIEGTSSSEVAVHAVRAPIFTGVRVI